MSLFSGIATLAGSFIGARAANKAADAQVSATEAATAEQRRQYDQTRSDQMPFYNTGVGGNQQLAYLLGINQNPYKQTNNGVEATIDPYANVNKGIGDFGSLSRTFSMQDYQQDPGYQFRLEEGLKALDRANSAKGRLNSGAAIKGITDYAQGMASQEYNNAYNRYNTNQTNLYNRFAGISGTGQNSANMLANVGQNTANNISENMIGAGNARAAGAVGAANAWSTGLNNIASMYTPAGGSSPWQINPSSAIYPRGF
jgi:hypothetical protein